MGSDGEGRGSAAAPATRPRKRQLVMDSSDSEADDEFCISTRRDASGAASVGNAGAGSQGGGDQSGEKPVTATPEKVSGVKSSGGDGSGKKMGVGLQSSGSQPAAKKIRVETVHGGGSGGASKGGTGGKMLPRGLPTWRFERPEVRGGRVLDEKDGAGVKASSASKMKEQLLNTGDKRRQVELQKHERQTPLKTDQGKAVDSGQQEVLRLQGKRGVLKILPKHDKVVRSTGDGKVLSRQTKVDGEISNGRIPTKSGVLKLLPKSNGVVMESNDRKLLSKKVKVDEETRGDKMPMKNTKLVDKETSDGKVPAIATKLDGEFGGHKVPMKNCAVDMETVAGKFQHRKSKADGETNERYKGYEERSGAPAEFQKQDASGEKKVVGKLLSPIALRKSDPSVVGISLGQRMKQQNSKQQLKNNSSLSLKDGIAKSSGHKNLKKRLLEHKGSSESLSKKAQSKAVDLQGTSGPVLNKLQMKKPRGGPLNKHKQDLRNKIKRVLLDNGWKIDLRQRKNKDYEDSVYVSPVGTGYWSITKAYAVFQEQFQNMGHSSKLNNAKPGASDAISKDDLALLKKNIVKRRTNKEIRGVEKKPGVSRNKKRRSKDILANRGSRNKHQNKEDRVKIKDRRCGLLVRGTHDPEDNMDGYIPYEWKCTVYSWMIDLGVVSEDMQVKYMNNNRTKEMLGGKITREGIFCGCCSKIITVTKFELHAGSKEKNPYANIFLEGGRVSLLQCLLDAWEKHKQCENKEFYKIDKGEDEHDDTCAICGDGGDLVCCDRCTSTYHLDCLGIKLPSGDWYCRSCLCRFCGFPQEKPSSSPELLHSCLQCSRKYHQTCSSGMGTDSDCTIPDTSIDCFCSPGCRKIYKRLNKLLGIKNHMEAGFSWSLVRCFANDRAIPLKNKEELALCNSKIALAFTVLNECFQAHIDERSGINIIHNVAYNCGSNFNRLDFSGFYAFILERGDEVISAASVRIHGTDLAEMPFIGTRGMHRHKGMCRRLLNGIESALCSLSVQKLVISAVTEMEDTWTTVFSFKPVKPSKKQRIKSLNLLIMNGTDLLEKRLLPVQTVDGHITTKTANNAVGSDKMDVKMLGEASGSVTPIHVSSEFDAVDNLEIKRHEGPHPLGNTAGSTLDHSPAAEDNEAKITIERTSLVSIGDVKAVKLHTLPGANCGVNMCMAEAENIQEEKYKETNGSSIAENTILEQKCEDKSNSSHSNSLATPVTVDQRSCLSIGIGKGENCLSSELSIGGAPITGKTESNLTPVHCDNHEDEKAYAPPVDTKVPLVIMNENPDKHEFKTMVVGYSESSMEAKSLEDRTSSIVNGTSMGANRDISTNEDHSASAVDSGISVKLYAQQMEIIEDKTGSLLPDLKHSSSCEDMLVTLTESKSHNKDMVEMDDTIVNVGMTGKSFSGAGITAPALNISDAVGENVVKPTQTCGEGQLHGDDVIYNNSSMEDDLASREPVNA